MRSRFCQSRLSHLYLMLYRAAVPPAKKAKVLAAFGADEDEDQPKRKLIPLQYR